MAAVSSAASAAPAAAQPQHSSCSPTQHEPTGKLSTAKVFGVPMQPLQHAITCPAQAYPVQSAHGQALHQAAKAFCSFTQT